MNSMNSLSADQLRRAAVIKDQIEALESELGQILGGSAGVIRANNGKRTMSASARARIAAAQRARWAKVKGKRGGKSSGGSGRKMSAAARAKIAAAARARWAKAKAAGRRTL
jgi:hypothetical protein